MFSFGLFIVKIDVSFITFKLFKDIHYVYRFCKLRYIAFSIPTIRLLNMFQFPRPGEENLKFRMELANRFSPAFRVYIGPFWYMVSCCHPSTIKAAIKGTEAKPLLNNLSGYRFIRPWLGM